MSGTLTISGVVAAGTIAPNTDSYVTVTPSGYVGGTGLALKSPGQSVTNSGVLSGDIGDQDDGLALNDDTGGVAVNLGSISGYAGVKATTVPITLTNDASIYGSRFGVQLQAGGAVNNGATGIWSAEIRGYVGVYIGSGTVTNFGTIFGTSQSDVGGGGVLLIDGGKITNGAVYDTNALIKTYGYAAVDLGGVGATLVNFGTIDGATNKGVHSEYGQEIINGGPTDHVALIESYSAILLFGGLGESAATVNNFGTIQSSGAAAAGITIEFGEVTNGGGTDRSALIEGASGVDCFSSDDTVNNFGTVEALGGAGFYGVSMGGGTFANGSVNNSTALIEGYGGLSFGGTGEASNFGVIWGQGDAGGAGVLLGGGAGLTNGSASHQGAVIEGYVGISLSSAGTVTNFGTIIGEGGEAVVFAAATDVLNVEAGSAFVGAVDGGGGTLDVASGSETITGALAGSGVTISGGISAGAFNDFATVDIGVAATVTLSGSIAVPSTVTVSGKLLAANGTTLTGAGTLILTDSASNAITGVTATSLFTNDIKIEGEGQLGDGAMEFTNAHLGTIYSLGAGTLTLNTGKSTLQNAGEIVSDGTGGLTISSPIDNTGRLIAYSSPLTVTGAVTGAGTAEVENAGTLILEGAFNEDVTFAAGSTGALELGDSKGYTSGEITGFSKTGANALDLLDIPFVSGTTKAVYSGTATSGVLTVTEGANVAKITLEGDYIGSTFTVSAGPGGTGTKVVDPSAPPAPTHVAAPLSPHTFIAAMAGFGAPAAGAVALGGELWRAPAPALATPMA